MKRLPDTEFEIMKVIWSNKPPITTNIVMEQLGNRRNWKAPSAISMLLRLVDKGFLRTEKSGKERIFYPIIEKDEYLQFETNNFIEQYHENSFVNLVSSLYDGKKLRDTDLEGLIEWIKERRE